MAAAVARHCFGDPILAAGRARSVVQAAMDWSPRHLFVLDKEDNTRGFRHAVGKNCQIGSSTSTARAIEVFLTSSIRVDSMTWAACELLYKHRKPPICYSPIVTQFASRYNFQDKLASRTAGLSAFESTRKFPGGYSREVYAEMPGSDAETELIELLEVISQSTPISATVCVEGFIIKGPGMYSTLIYGCGSPSFYRSVLFASSTSKASQFLRDKAWLTSDSLGFMGMTLFIRENHRTIFILHGATKSNGDRILEHRSMRNISASGSLYISMIMADLALLAFSIRSVVEISRYMMWALWKPLVASEYQISSAQTTRMGFGVEDYTRVLQISLLWSTPIALLTIVSRLLTWALVIPCFRQWSDGANIVGDTHALLTMIRFYDLVVVCVNIIWNMVTVYNEKVALAFVRHTYISPPEIMTISVAVAVGGASLGGLQSYGSMLNRQSQIDCSPFENTFGESACWLLVFLRFHDFELEDRHPLEACAGGAIAKSNTRG
ncbi:hypothetical protein GN244_ATG10741 [Phytophthora infestans]|uniref:Transmembrane protein n=1 Tax=Phytophthora infestans TaxID=4787 RepID=A0A833SRN5_PHYIN|nr:hypothetical protein GN244_ATG10741 [Phytophthora infestans]